MFWLFAEIYSKQRHQAIIPKCLSIPMFLWAAETLSFLRKQKPGLEVLFVAFRMYVFSWNWTKMDSFAMTIDSRNCMQLERTC